MSCQYHINEGENSVRCNVKHARVVLYVIIKPVTIERSIYNIILVGLADKQKQLRELWHECVRAYVGFKLIRKKKQILC